MFLEVGQNTERNVLGMYYFLLHHVISTLVSNIDIYNKTHDRRTTMLVSPNVLLPFHIHWDII